MKKHSDELPSEVAVTKEQVDKYWDYWLLWRTCERRLEAFVLLVDLQGPPSKAMLDVFLELDTFYGKMEAKKMKEESERQSKRK